MLLRTRTARAAAAAALVIAVPTLAGCGMNFATDKVYTPAPGANDRDNRVDVLNAMIVASEDGEGTLTVTVSNNEFVGGVDRADVSDELTGVSGDITASAFKAVKIPTAGHVKFDNTSPTPTSRAKIDQPGIKVTGDFAVGDFVNVEFDFRNSDPVTLQVPVLPNSGPLAGEDGDELRPTLQDRISESHGESTGEGGATEAIS
ncbi:MAG: hypothetical protein L0H93_14715 [Nocardioides sp.]|nr:hypothetical protein [Nocardioides sp.]